VAGSPRTHCCRSEHAPTEGEAKGGAVNQSSSMIHAPRHYLDPES
jgi:hypothetical protein